MIAINPELFRICLWQIHTIYTRLPNGAISGVISERWESLTSIFGIAWSPTDSHKSVEAFRHVGWKVEHQQSAFGLWPNTKDKVFVTSLTHTLLPFCCPFVLLFDGMPHGARLFFCPLSLFLFLSASLSCCLFFFLPL